MLDSFQWQEIECQSLIPSPRANCLTQIVGDTIFIMGGDNLFGTCGDLLTFKIGKYPYLDLDLFM